VETDGAIEGELPIFLGKSIFDRTPAAVEFHHVLRWPGIGREAGSKQLNLVSIQENAVIRSLRRTHTGRDDPELHRPLFGLPRVGVRMKGVNAQIHGFPKGVTTGGADRPPGPPLKKSGGFGRMEERIPRTPCQDLHLLLQDEAKSAHASELSVCAENDRMGIGTL
jgi:hypothetical protein